MNPTPNPMSEPMTPAQREALVRGTAAQLGLVLGSDQIAGVVRYHALAGQMAEQVMGWPLTPADEPATVFIPVPAQADTP